MVRGLEVLPRFQAPEVALMYYFEVGEKLKLAHICLNLALGFSQMKLDFG